MDEAMRPWCSLPDELLSLIVSKLLGADFVVFHAVCKRWSGTPLPITQQTLPPGSDPPFLLLPGNKLLLHPIYKYSHHMQVFYEEGAYIRASHSGWLLMTLSKSCIFFFNPCTKEKVELADLSIPLPLKLTFFSKPTSPDCLVFGVQQRLENTEVVQIYTIKPGQPAWETQTIYCRRHFILSSSRPIFFKGLFYCLGKGGTLLIYDPEDDRVQWVGPPNPPIPSGLGYQYYMVESKGELLLVYTNRDGHSVNVARLDASKRAVWNKIDNLGDTMLFVSHTASFSVTSTVRGFRNKIFFSRFGGDDDKLLFYSLDTHKYHCFDGDRIRDNFDNTKIYPNSTWIEPCPSS